MERETAENWLRSNLVEVRGADVARDEVFNAYVSNCTAQGLPRVANNIFGKIFRRVFPHVESRRLGKRGQNKAHYINLQWRSKLSEKELQEHEEGRRSPSPPSPLRFVWVAEDEGKLKRKSRKRKREEGEEDEEEEDQMTPVLSSFTSTSTSTSSSASSLPSSLALLSSSSTSLTASTSTSLSSSFSSDLDKYLFDTPHTEGHTASASSSYASLLSSSSSTSLAVPQSPQFQDISDLLALVNHESFATLELPPESIEALTEALFEDSSSSSSPTPDIESEYMLIPKVEMEDHEQHQRSLSATWSTGAHLTLLFTINRYRKYYRSETFHLFPLNPKCLKLSTLSYLLTTDEGSEEISPIALSAYTMISIASFMCGDLSVSLEYYHKARDQLGALFDCTDYDTAAALLPLAWWSRFNAENEEDGRRKEVYCNTIGVKMCEMLGAVNDRTYEGHVRMMAVHEMRNSEKQLENAKQYPPYESAWPKTKRTTPAHSTELHLSIRDVYSTVLQCYTMYTSGEALTQEQKSFLTTNLEAVSNILLMLNSHKETTPSQVSAILASLALSLRTMILKLLDLPEQSSSAQEVIMHLSTMEEPLMLIILLELSANGYLLIKMILDILLTSNASALDNFAHTLDPYCSRYYWIRWIRNYMPSSSPVRLRSISPADLHSTTTIFNPTTESGSP